MESHQCRNRYMRYGNSMTFDEDYQVFPLAEIDDEIEILRQFNHI